MANFTTKEINKEIENGLKRFERDLVRDGRVKKEVHELTQSFTVGLVYIDVNGNSTTTFLFNNLLYTLPQEYNISFATKIYVNKKALVFPHLEGLKDFDANKKVVL